MTVYTKAKLLPFQHVQMRLTQGLTGLAGLKLGVGAHMDNPEIHTKARDTGWTLNELHSANMGPYMEPIINHLG